MSPENTNYSSNKPLPAEAFVSGLNYPVGGAFHLDPGFLPFHGRWGLNRVIIEGDSFG